MVLIGFLFYNYFYKTYSDQLSNLKTQKQDLQTKLDQLNSQLLRYESYKKNFKEIENQYYDLSKRLPPNQDEKFSMLDLQNLASKVNTKATDFTISQKQKLNINYNNLNITNAYFYSFKQNWLITYADFKKLLYLQKDFYPLFSVEGITLSNAENKVNASFEVKFYGFEDNLAPVRQWSGFGLTTGKGNLFQGGAAPRVEFNYTPESIKKNESTQQTSKMTRSDNKNSNSSNQTVSQPSSNNQNKQTEQKPENTQGQSNSAVNYADADFVVTVSTTFSPTTNITLEKAGQGSIFGANKKIENAQIIIKGENGNYSYRLLTEASVFPQGNGFKEFTPNKKETIKIVVFSSPRKYKDDKNIVTIKISNLSKARIDVFVVNDDKNSPRVNVVGSGANIKVTKT